MYRDKDLALLARPLHAFLTVAPKPGRWPAPRPVWYELAGDGTLQLFSFAEAPKVQRLREEPRASLVVAAPTGEPEHWVSTEGHVTIHEDGASELAARLADRYYDMSDPAKQKLVAEWSGFSLVRIVIHPEVVNRYAG
ncbi:putative pyridoxamine 5'-phosphate oxidase-related protein [Actinoplanes missouriensis 431]|uniref:Putative pyridoxamine 5'-phosphate oxidase-related protein n=1 Tax=Actinoplanes missouriensis (strain ATCC 14538 / DSM 43046 / CBS 188.64 / JCM 3121 / NBRC 102363 / NCIMB 12654 / NRRL B-3342 / UNCC 431) TaxID=512565 RepID=I0H9M5_ACTM4|nr:pyridoxamine 5'-phosphate oxidase family protein [Actinoplanes missouriensis]BAL89712.1 putative pyridoxamine 5'-phosphate oxidase-related protein [Actinoplanes missouriensis 431]